MRAHYTVHTHKNTGVQAVHKQTCDGYVEMLVRVWAGQSAFLFSFLRGSEIHADDVERPISYESGHPD